jgi:predicted CopG family antitoxin
MGEPITTIEVKQTTWQALNVRKTPGDSFDDVIQRLLQETESHSPIESQPQQPRQDTSEARERGESSFALPDTLPDRIDREGAREAIEAAVSFIERNNGATMREIVPAVGQEHDLGYDVPSEIPQGERYRSAFWRKCIRPGLENHPEIQKPNPGQSEWGYVG